MPKHHIIISGTGRSGTTCLVQLLTELKIDTGFQNDQDHLDPNCNAGMEYDLRQPTAPYIVKSPWICDYLEEVLQGGEVIIDHAIVPMRDLYSAAESRRDVVRRTNPAQYNSPDAVPGGLWHTCEPDKQEDILAGQLYKLVYALAKHDVPLTLLFFPYFTHDPMYLYRKLRCVLGEIPYELFLKGFERVMKPNLVHDFSPSNKAVSS